MDFSSLLEKKIVLILASMNFVLPEVERESATI